jgi:hypothetical protein
MKIYKPSQKILSMPFLPFLFLIGQISFSHFERVSKKERRGNGRATFKVDIEVEGAKMWKKVEKVAVLVLVMVVGASTH